MKYLQQTLLMLLALGGLNACAKQDGAEQHRTEVKPKMSTTYQVGNLQGGQFTPLGTISFDKDNKIELSVSTAGPAAAELQSAIDELAKQDPLHVKRSEEHGNEVRYVGIDVAKSSAEYPDAVLDYLSSEHGFFATPLANAQ